MRLRSLLRGAFVRRRKGQALTETALLVMLLFGFTMALVFFFPDSMNALQIHMDGYYFVLSMPVP
jgi:Flp pilus assembly protein TadG